jgi:hypothetical protein
MGGAEPTPAAVAHERLEPAYPDRWEAYLSGVGHGLGHARIEPTRKFRIANP